MHDNNKLKMQPKELPTFTKYFKVIFEKGIFLERKGFRQKNEKKTSSVVQQNET